MLSFRPLGNERVHLQTPDVNLLSAKITLEVLNYFCITHGDQRVYFNLKQICLIHLNTYVMGLRPLEKCLSYSAGIDFSRQNLTCHCRDPQIQVVKITHICLI